MNILPYFIRRKLEHRPSLLKVFDNIGWLFFDKLLRMGVGLLVGVWVARYLGPEQFGLLNFAMAFTGVLGALAGLGLSSIVVRDIVQCPTDKAEILGAAALLQLIGGLFAYGIVLLGIFFLRPDDSMARLIVAIVGGGLLFKAADTIVFWFESQVQSRYTVLVQNSVFLVFAVIKVFLILNDASLLAFAWVVLGEALVVAGVLLVVMEKRGVRFSDFRLRKARVLLLLKDSWPLCLSAMSIMIYMKVDQIMLGQMAGNEAVGVFSAAARISEILYFVPIVICASVFPSMLEVRRRDEELYYRRLQRLFDLMVWSSIVIALPMTFCADWVVNKLFGAGYGAAGSVLAIHIWASVFVFLGVASGQWLVAEGLQLLSMQRTVLGAASNILFNFLFIPSFGASGAAVATILSFSVVVFFSDLINYKTRKILFMKIESFNLVLVFRRWSNCL